MRAYIVFVYNLIFKNNVSRDQSSCKIILMMAEEQETFSEENFNLLVNLLDNQEDFQNSTKEVNDYIGNVLRK